MKVHATNPNQTGRPDGAAVTAPGRPSEGRARVAAVVPQTTLGLPLRPDRNELDEAVAKINETAQALHRALEFVVVEDRIVVKVVDTVSQEVIREIPPERLILALRRMDETFGLLLDHKL